jgi:hypothetical protein
MFSSTGLFKQVPCPKQDECTLPTCIFSHSSSSIAEKPGTEVQEYDPSTAGTFSSPPAKRRKLDGRDIGASLPIELLRQSNQEYSVSNPKEVTKVSVPGNERQGKPDTALLTQSRHTPKTTLPNTKSATIANTKPVTANRSVSPPPVKTKSKPGAGKPPSSITEESLVPRPVPKAPDLLKKRHAILQTLYQQLEAQNNRRVTGDAKKESLVLSEQELIKFALDEEENAARKYESEIYRNHITKQIFKIKKMSEQEWTSLVVQKVRKPAMNIPKTTADSTKPPPRPVTGLSSAEEEMAVLRSLRTSLVGLEDYGYVTKQPTAAEIASAEAGVQASAGWEKCDRCDTRFQVIPGRDDQGRLTTGGTCRYHWAKWNRPPPQKTDRANGRGQFTYTCCNQEIGSEGCTEAETHVFKTTDKKRLASILQFEHTPTVDHGKKTPVSFDCEMGYTTLGLEVIRVTAVSWPEGSDLLDVLVRPYGEVLDLNTRFSGVTKKSFADAVPYKNRTDNGDATKHDALEAQPLQKVESPAAARQLLFDLLTPETPLIGHAIDNDLNVVRIIHPTVIDTVLLYPHPKGLPIRFGLKMLASKHLDRSIQMSGAAGHDSKEDAIATGDLAIVAVAEKWKKMKREGWKFENSVLVAPEAVKKAPAMSKATL